MAERDDDKPKLFVSPRQRQAMIDAGLDVSNVEETHPMHSHSFEDAPAHVPDYLGAIDKPVTDRKTTAELLAAYTGAPWLKAAVVAAEVERDLMLFGEHVRDANGQRVDPRDVTIHNVEINGLDAGQIADAVQREADRRGETLAGRAITGHRATLEVSRDGQTWEPLSIDRRWIDVVPDDKEPGEMSAELRDVERDADGNITRARIVSMSPALGALWGQPFKATTMIPVDPDTTRHFMGGNAHAALVQIDPTEAAARRKALADEAAEYERQRTEMMRDWMPELRALYDALTRQPHEGADHRPLTSRQYGRIVRRIPPRVPVLGVEPTEAVCIWCGEPAVLIVDTTQHGSNGDPMHLACWAEAEAAEQYRYLEDRWGDSPPKLADVVEQNSHDNTGHEEDLQARRYLEENPTATLTDYRVVRRLRSSWQRRETERRQRERAASRMTRYGFGPSPFRRPSWAPDSRANLVRASRGMLVPPEIVGDVLDMLYAPRVVPLYTPEHPRLDVTARDDK